MELAIENEVVDGRRAAFTTCMGMPEWIAEGYVELNRGFEDGYADTTTDGVERLTGRPPRSFGQFAVDFSEAFARSPAPA